MVDRLGETRTGRRERIEKGSREGLESQGYSVLSPKQSHEMC